jgi:hypothetical protein
MQSRSTRFPALRFVPEKILNSTGRAVVPRPEAASSPQQRVIRRDRRKGIYCLKDRDPAESLRPSRLALEDGEPGWVIDDDHLPLRVPPRVSTRTARLVASPPSRLRGESPRWRLTPSKVPSSEPSLARLARQRQR